MKDLKIKPLKKRSLVRDDICESIKEAILSGTLKPGDRIVETQWAKELGVSQSPVREAIRNLESIGLVYTVPYQGTYVSKITLQDLIDAHTIRTSLEVLGIKYAVKMITNKQLASLHKLLVEMENAGEANDIDLYVRKDAMFHRAIISVANKGLLIRIWDQCNIYEWTYFGTKFSDVELALLAKRHESIYNAIAARNEELAVNEVVQHLQDLIKRMQKRIDQGEELKF